MMSADARPLPMPKEDAGAHSPALRAWQAAIQLLREEHPDAYAVASRRVLSMMQGEVGDPLLLAMHATEALARLASPLGMEGCDPGAVVDAALARLAPNAAPAAVAPEPVRQPIRVHALAAELVADTSQVLNALVPYGVMATARDTLSPDVAALVRHELSKRHDGDAQHVPAKRLLADVTAGCSEVERERLTGELIVLASLHDVAISVSELSDLSSTELRRRISTLQGTTTESA